MEVFTGDRQTPKPDDFPLHIAPFPEPTDLLYAHPTATIHSASSITHRPISPPQKLRPIRCNVRSPVSDFPENGGLFETLEKGLLSNEASCAIDTELEYCAVKVEASEAPKSAGCGNGNGLAIVGDPVQLGSGTVEEGGDPNGGEHVVEDGSR